MNKPLEIVLTTLHVGTGRRVVTLGLNGRDHAGEFLGALERSNPKGVESIRSRIEFVAEHDRYENEFTDQLETVSSSSKAKA